MIAGYMTSHKWEMHMPRLSDEQVVALREASAEGRSRQELAEEFGVDSGTVSRIVRGESRAKAGGPLSPKLSNKADEEWYEVDETTGCWLWQGRFTSNGYGVHATAYDRGYSQLAHRYFYESRVEKIPGGMELDHLCSTPACVNPSHLEVVTAAENSRRKPSTKLDEWKVKNIRALYGRGGSSQAQLGKLFGVSRAAISSVVSNRNWHDPEYVPPSFGQGRRMDLGGSWEFGKF